MLSQAKYRIILPTVHSLSQKCTGCLIMKTVLLSFGNGYAFSDIRFRTQVQQYTHTYRISNYRIFIDILLSDPEMMHGL